MCLADLLLGRAAGLAQLKSTGGLDLVALLAAVIVVQIVLRTLPLSGIFARLKSRAFWGSMRWWLGGLAVDVVAIGILLALGERSPVSEARPDRTMGTENGMTCDGVCPSRTERRTASDS